MFGFLKYCLINILFTVFVLFQSESAYVSDIIFENQEEYNGIHAKQYKLDVFQTSKHVFYWLFTRDNPNGQQLNRSESLMTESTTYNAENPTKVIVHGWLGSVKDNDSLCLCIMKSYLKVGDYNVICVDWRQYSMDISYVTATLRAKNIGQDIANVLRRITLNMTKGVDNLHLIGHSLGAHIVGFTGKILTNQISRISGLDPAKPLYDDKGPKDRLDKSDAIFVDIIHTNGNMTAILWSLGHIDFFPNGGKSQPNCEITDLATAGTCSHLTAYRYFAHSIWAKEDYVALKCDSWNNYKHNKCRRANKTYMGEHVDKGQTGDYYLRARIDNTMK